MIRAALTGLMLAASLSASCAHAETPGKDGNVTIASSGAINQYAQISGTAAAGSTSLTAVNLATAMPGLAEGDLIMIYQAQGATIDSSDSASFGAVTAYGSAGRYEFQTVASVSGNTITFASYAGGCGGLRASYSGSAGGQIVRVPQYRNLTVNSGVTVSAQAWNGTTGGIVAMTVSQTLTVNGTISANAAGFRGGATDNGSSAFAATTYRTSDITLGAEKGESVAGYQGAITGGLYFGRGAPANGGGGGNAHNGGGGGGANGDSGNPWAGQGRPDTSGVNWSAAWNLDPSLTATTSNAGGGRGGYSYAANNLDATLLGPGNIGWGGDNRRELGGLGGRPLAFDRTSRVFFGGGGGAGDGNNGAAGAGGAGGGFVFLQAATVSGSGSVTANGAAGGSTAGAGNDAPGGGGGGGSIVAQIGSGGALTFAANGGAGGNQVIGTVESEGPGGGGGGGVIAVTGSPLSRTANGGANGTTNSTAVTEFIPNGATMGATGQPTAIGPGRSEVPICYAPAPILSKSSTAYETTGINRFRVPAADVIYTLTVTNPGTQIDSGSLALVDTLPVELTFYNGDIDDAGPLSGNFQFVDGSPGSTLTCCAVAYSAQTTGSDFSYVPAAGYDPNVRRIRYTPAGAMAPGSIAATSFQIRLRARIN